LAENVRPLFLDKEVREQVYTSGALKALHLLRCKAFSLALGLKNSEFNTSLIDIYEYIVTFKNSIMANYLIYEMSMIGKHQPK